MITKNRKVKPQRNIPKIYVLNTSTMFGLLWS